MLRVAEDRIPWPFLDDPARVHHHHPLGDVGDDTDVVGDQDDRGAVIALEALHQLEDLRLDRDVECRRRLVGDQERRVARERHRDHHALAHPAGELVRKVIGAALRIRDADLRQELDCSGVRSLCVHGLVCAQLLGDLPADGVDRRERRHRILKDHRDLGAADRADLVSRQLQQVPPLVEHMSLDHGVRVADQPHHRQHRDGLAGAGLTDDPDHFARRDRERDAVDRAHESLLGTERDAEVLNLEQRRACGLRQCGPAGRARRRRGRRSRSPGRRRTRRT